MAHAEAYKPVFGLITKGKEYNEINNDNGLVGQAY